LSDGTSIRNHRITKSYFRTCLSRRTRSQAPLCLCTQLLTFIQDEGTFERLRYSLGGNRPSQTTHLTLSSVRFHGLELEPQSRKGGISLAAPPRPKSGNQSLPPMLRILPRNSILSYSKAPRGLFVYPQVVRVFTDTTISPSLPPRQFSFRYAIRAGRNLPDKEFRSQNPRFSSKCGLYLYPNFSLLLPVHLFRNFNNLLESFLGKVFIFLHHSHHLCKSVKFNIFF